MIGLPHHSSVTMKSKASNGNLQTADSLKNYAVDLNILSNLIKTKQLRVEHHTLQNYAFPLNPLQHLLLQIVQMN
jgi:hypothetical protein